LRQLISFSLNGGPEATEPSAERDIVNGWRRIARLDPAGVDAVDIEARAALADGVRHHCAGIGLAGTIGVTEQGCRCALQRNHIIDLATGRALVIDAGQQRHGNGCHPGCRTVVRARLKRNRGGSR
jgi:hypothetical protein